MTQQSMSSLFSDILTPEDVRNSQLSSDRLLGQQLQQGSAALLYAPERARRLQRNIGNIAGVDTRTEAEKKAQVTQQIMKGMDINDPESLKAAARRFQEAGLVNAAAQALQQARNLELQSRDDITWEQGQEDRTNQLNRTKILQDREDWRFEQEKLTVSRDKEAREIGNEAMQTISFDPMNPDMVSYYGAKIKIATERGRADLADEYAKELSDYKEKQMQRLNTSLGVISAKDYTAAGASALNTLRTELASLSPNSEAYKAKLQEMQQMQAEYAKQAAKEKALMAEAEAKAKAEGEAEVKNFEDAKKSLSEEEEALADNMSFIRDLDNIIEKADEDKIFTGFGAEVKMDLVKFGQAIGIQEADWQTKAANTEQAMTLLSAKILEKIKQLGANPSNADREFLAKTLPMVTTSREGLNKIREYMALRALGAHDTLKQKREYLRENRNLDGFESTATAEMVEFLKREQIDAAKLNQKNSSTPAFSDKAVEAFKGGQKPFAVFSYPVERDGKRVNESRAIYAYPDFKVSAALVREKYNDDEDAMLRRATVLKNTVLDNYNENISQRSLANAFEEFSAIQAAIRQMIQEGK